MVDAWEEKGVGDQEKKTPSHTELYNIEYCEEDVEEEIKEEKDNEVTAEKQG